MTKKEILRNEIAQYVEEFNNLNPETPTSVARLLIGTNGRTPVATYEGIRDVIKQRIEDLKHDREVAAYWAAHPDKKKRIEDTMEMLKVEGRKLLTTYCDTLNEHLAPFGFKTYYFYPRGSFDIRSAVEGAHEFDSVGLYMRESFAGKRSLQFNVGSCGGFEADTKRAQMYVNFGRLLTNENETNHIFNLLEECRVKQEVTQDAYNELKKQLTNPNMEE